MTRLAPGGRASHGRAATAALVVAALAAIALQFPGRLYASAAALAIWLGASALLDHPSLGRLWQPRFILLSSLLALLSGLLLGTPDRRLLGVPVSTAGLEAGAIMLLRAILIVAISASASRLLSGRHASVPATEQKGIRQTAAVALELVPQLRSRIRSRITVVGVRQSLAALGRFGALEEAAVRIVCDAALLGEGLSHRETAAHHGRPVKRRQAGRLVVAFVGPAGSGKTTAIGQVGRRLGEHGTRVRGILQPASRGSAGGASYDLEDFESGERRSFVTRDPVSGDAIFDAGGWSWASERIRAGRLEADVLIVDEIGRIEAGGAGHLEALLLPVEGERARVWLLAVRDLAAVPVAAAIGGFDHVVRPPFTGASLADAELRIRQARMRGSPLPLLRKAGSAPGRGTAGTAPGSGTSEGS